MKLEQKHIWLIVGGVVLLAAIGIGIYLITRPKDKDPENENDGNGEKNNGGEPPDKETNEPDDPNPTPTYNNTYPSGTIGPIYNVEGELENPIGELKGVVLYPKRKSAGGWGYANVRSSAEVNDISAWYDPYTNLLTTINSGIPIGKVLTEVAGLYNGYSYRWFKVSLIKPAGAWSSKEGYVRGDTVTFIPFKK